MNQVNQISVREHQRWVLMSLRLARNPVTPLEIARHLNSFQKQTRLPHFLPEEVEASIAALRLRPELVGLIVCNARQQATRQRHIRSRTTFALGGAVVMSACTTLPSTSTVIPKPQVSYFGSSSAKPIPWERPAFDSVYLVNGQAMVGSFDGTTLAFADKTPVAEAVAATVASYFDPDPPTGYAQREDARMASPELLASLEVPKTESPSSAPAAVDMGVRQTRVATVVYSLSDSAQLVGSLQPPPLSFMSIFDTTSNFRVRSFTVSAKPVSTSSSPSPKVQGHVGTVNRQSISNLVLFGNGSIVLSEHSRETVRAMAAEARSAPSVHLLGRVGFRQLDAEHKRQAVARAIAVRDVLVAEGVQRSKIRIVAPASNDLVDTTNPAAGSNRSVTVSIGPVDMPLRAIAKTQPAPTPSALGE